MTYSEVKAGPNSEGKPVVKLRFEDGQNSAAVVVVDRATAARLINQLRKELDK